MSALTAGEAKAKTIEAINKRTENNILLINEVVLKASAKCKFSANIYPTSTITISTIITVAESLGYTTKFERVSRRSETGYVIISWT